MMKIKTLTLTILITLAVLGSFGCAGEEEARQVALQLRADIVEDEQLIDKTIERQTTFYAKQLKTIEDSRADNIKYELDGKRRQRSAEAVTIMSINPDQEARLNNLIQFLVQSNEKEYEAWKKLYAHEQQAREDLKSKIAKLQRQKKVLTQVKDNLNQLALSPNRKKRAMRLLKFSKETIAAVKASQ
jgi:DNA-directed RNA polymerase subunit F